MLFNLKFPGQTWPTGASVQPDGKIFIVVHGRTSGGGPSVMTGTTAVIPDIFSGDQFAIFVNLEGLGGTLVPTVSINGVDYPVTIDIDSGDFSTFQPYEGYSIGAKESTGGTFADFFNGDLSPPYWSINRDFGNRIAEYANLPTVELN